MSDTGRLDPLVRHAERREHEGARQLGECRAALTAGERQLGMLNAYREDYRARFAGAAETGVNALRARSYQAFLRQLDTAIEQTLLTIAQQQEQLRVAEKDWLTALGRRRALAQAAQRRKLRAHRAGERREQRRLDEHAGSGAQGGLFER